MPHVQPEHRILAGGAHGIRLAAVAARQRNRTRGDGLEVVHARILPHPTESWLRDEIKPRFTAMSEALATRAGH
ncbi:hypothetical protein GCM10009744_50780 [Kribbella alba]|uniref:Pyridine nucleotide-disulphide oxidoreductase dimerisation domain-containing protein n=1 Tax=Kribbella alba TaxID=190197 RepID=A0ABN2FLM6_9ACTN